MIRKLQRKQLQAELSAVGALLARLPSNDLLGRASLESRRRRITEELEQLAGADEKTAKIALYFGGEPVVGSLGVQAEFGTTAVSHFQDLVTKVWASSPDSHLPAMGPIKDKELAQLHITNLVHGSFGFLLEEIDQKGEPLFQSPLSIAADIASQYVAMAAADKETQFAELLEDIDPRVFTALKDFMSPIYKCKATLRIVEGDIDVALDREAVERAWVRIEGADVDDQDVTLEGRLLGIIPVGRRFEFEPDGSMTIIKGKVAAKFSQTYLEKMSTQKFGGERWRAQLRRKTVKRKTGPAVETYTLIELDKVENGTESS